MKMKYFNILWANNIQKFRELEGIFFFQCGSYVYAHKHLRYKLFANLSTCVCFVYSCLFVDVCLIHSIKKHELRSTLVSKHLLMLLFFLSFFFFF